MQGSCSITWTNKMFLSSRHFFSTAIRTTTPHLNSTHRELTCRIASQLSYQLPHVSVEGGSVSYLYVVSYDCTLIVLLSCGGMEMESQFPVALVHTRPWRNKPVQHYLHPSARVPCKTSFRVIMLKIVKKLK
jgi:hypothetical protein